MKYKGKIGFWWLIILIALNGLLAWIPFNLDKANMNPIFGIVTVIIIDIWFLYMTFRNYIVLDETSMTIVLGVSKLKLRYDEIISIKKTRSPLASMALSLDRIEVISKTQQVYISVKNKEGLIKDLLSRNTGIVVKI